MKLRMILATNLLALLLAPPLIAGDFSNTASERFAEHNGPEIGAYNDGLVGQRPFRLTATGQLTAIPPLEPGSDPECNANLTPEGNHPGAFVTIIDVGWGTGSHLGHFSFETITCLNPVTGEAPGWGSITAANGDDVFIEFFNSPAPAPDGFSGFAGPQTVVGGTGRFEGASGDQECWGQVNDADLSVEFECSGNLSFEPGAASAE